MATVFVRDLRFTTIIGCLDWERQAPQRVSIDLAMEWDIDAAVQGDDLGHALDYQAVADRVTEFVQAQEFKLVESAVAGIADLIITEFKVPELTVTLSKPHAVSGAAAVGVTLTRRA
ncbi:MAG: dihydroneopterin aldolase [Gammaproteobacteria bacterium]|nr:dihydroneopterin aldolase [Gammaproteobacteria bacterium]NND54314.1 dihydroneopterin aldolase [Gammaproteobacteria bacterium]